MTSEYNQSVKASAKVVYDAFTRNDLLVEWFCDVAEVNARAEGYLFAAWILGYEAVGTFTAVERNKSLALLLRGSDETVASPVTITLQEKDGVTDVKVVHQNASERWQRIWTQNLENLQSHLETGYDLRQTRRALMGVNIGPELTEERVKQLGLPVSKGVLLDGTIANLSAASAGIKAHDVIVSLGGKPTDDFLAMTKTIQQAGYRAGDSTDIEYYRGAEKHQATLTFTIREVQPIPTPEEYVNTLETLYAKLETELRALFNDVPEAAAAQRPAPEEWSAKETVAHLIAGQRWAIQFIGDRLANQEGADWNANNTHVVAALAKTYATVADLITELNRIRTETLNLLRSLPEDFLVKRGSWARMHQFTNFFEEHDHEHHEQIKKALEAARVPAGD
jgi:uncharacterized protein YndB with AHSA1/START domain